MAQNLTFDIHFRNKNVKILQNKILKKNSISLEYWSFVEKVVKYHGKK